MNHSNRRKGENLGLGKFFLGTGAIAGISPRAGDVFFVLGVAITREPILPGQRLRSHHKPRHPVVFFAIKIQIKARGKDNFSIPTVTDSPTTTVAP